MKSRRSRRSGGPSTAGSRTNDSFRKTPSHLDYWKAKEWDDRDDWLVWRTSDQLSRVPNGREGDVGPNSHDKRLQLRGYWKIMNAEDNQTPEELFLEWMDQPLKNKEYVKAWRKPYTRETYSDKTVMKMFEKYFKYVVDRRIDFRIRKEFDMVSDQFQRFVSLTPLLNLCERANNNDTFETTRIFAVLTAMMGNGKSYAIRNMCAVLRKIDPDIRILFMAARVSYAQTLQRELLESSLRISALRRDDDDDELTFKSGDEYSENDAEKYKKLKDELQKDKRYLDLEAAVLKEYDFKFRKDDEERWNLVRSQYVEKEKEMCAEEGFEFKKLCIGCFYWMYKDDKYTHFHMIPEYNTSLICSHCRDRLLNDDGLILPAHYKDKSCKEKENYNKTKLFICSMNSIHKYIDYNNGILPDVLVFDENNANLRQLLIPPKSPEEEEMSYTEKYASENCRCVKELLTGSRILICAEALPEMKYMQKILQERTDDTTILIQNHATNPKVDGKTAYMLPVPFIPVKSQKWTFDKIWNMDVDTEEFSSTMDMTATKVIVQHLVKDEPVMCCVSSKKDAERLYDKIIILVREELIRESQENGLSQCIFPQLFLA